MDNSTKRKIEAESAIEHARHDWVKMRIAQIHANVTSFDVLSRRGVSLVSTSDREEQFSCPFHGLDRKPSARIFPETSRGPSHVWCFVCQERWDAIKLWRKFNQDTDDVPFTRTLTEIERAYGLTTPEIPTDLRGNIVVEDPALKAFDDLLEVCERRLRGARPAYKTLKDMIGYLSASSLLDRIRFRVENRQVPALKGLEILRQLLDKIREKAQACPAG